ncbi:4-hydroxythreonine-4-phosphate dehydrogenase PdxA [Bradyrhizobium sp. LHD-71]|uniref:PdxA family dehydrogenase n=1 Tax=Bradyrhizobium sp. LHD-71 TaxID=3072141 RepID=UPI0028102EAB|nr:4-hydroxythreonine-4-phosphate dehydrogenase PdxA [Bradyrhizobium sp. LHD-71]MDQ8727619.1 4-hydroxythreonine-4-phosphate dehydrogenase PdxA [Bradyrhizobium sp. LHD-71]
MTPKAVALTIGDPNGIGPEIAVKAAVLCAEAKPDSSPILVGDEHVIRFYADKFAPGRTLTQAGTSADKRALLYHPVAALDAKAFQPGQGSPESGRATVAYVEAALDLITRGRAHCIVACPHSETNVNSAGITFSGYPSLLARLKKVPEDEVFLMLVGAGLRIVHVTLHERLFDALNRITPTLIERAIRTTIDALRNLGIPHPRLGVFGINPHAGEGGLFGDDDDRIVKPLVERLKTEGIDIEGPVGADLMLGQQGFDAFAAMYHDQGHIPIKLLAGRNSAAMSIGAGLMFSSVGHGGAFDIAGKGIADPTPVLRCIQFVAGANQFKETA